MSGTGRRGGFNPLVAGFIAGAVIAAVLALLANINLNLSAPWASTHTLTANVSDVDGISISSDVRIAGRLVGQITAVDAHGSYTSVTFHVDDGDWPLPSDTSASIRLATLLGQKYLQLAPGTSSSHLADNGTIGLSATQPVVDFDQILDTFNQPTRDSITSLIRTGAAAVQGQEGTLQQLIPDLSQLSVHSVVPTTELVTRNSEINNILINLGTTADQLDKSGADLAGVIDHMNSITGALAQHQSALEGYISQTDAINQTTDRVLGNGYAAKLNAGFQQLQSFTAQLTNLMTTLVPETFNFANDCRTDGKFISGNAATQGCPKGSQPVFQDALNLVYQIGSATAQSDLDGFFLRQNANGVDPCGLLGPTCVASNVPAPAAGSPSGNKGTGSVCVAGTCVTAPSLPSPVPLPTLPPVNGGNGGSGGSGGPVIPLPTPTGIPLLSNAYTSTAARWLSLWSWL